VTAQATSATSITITWSASTDDREVAGYRIYRDGSATPLATVSAGTSFADGTLEPSTRYAYAVRAFDTAGNESALSEPAAATTSDPPPPPGSYSAHVLAVPGLLSLWRLGEAAGTVAHDAKAARNATYVNGPRLGVGGALTGDADTAVEFDGVNDEVTLPAGPTTSTFTIEGWQKLATGAPTNNTLLGRALVVRLMPRPTGHYVGVFLGGTEYVMQGNGPANTGAWVHWALVRDGASMRPYRSGQQVASKTGMPTTGTPLTGSIGRYGSGYPAKGAIDEVALYTTALSPAEVLDHYERGR
jgi:hypothetical protein